MIKDLLITDFQNDDFQKAFKEYFSEIGVQIKNWDGLFAEMNNDKNATNFAYLRKDSDNVIGFIQFAIISAGNWFFKSKVGFVREFWIKNNMRNLGCGRELLNLAEKHLKGYGINHIVLTTHTAEKFYIKNGYSKNENIIAINNDCVYTKNLK